MCYNYYKFRDGKYFSTAEIGKTLTYHEYKNLAELRLVKVSDTDIWREKYRLVKRTKKKWEQIPETHANDAVAMLMGITGCKNMKVPFYIWQNFSMLGETCTGRIHKRVVSDRDLVALPKVVFSAKVTG